MAFNVQRVAHPECWLGENRSINTIVIYVGERPAEIDASCSSLGFGCKPNMLSLTISPASLWLNNSVHNL